MSIYVADKSLMSLSMARQYECHLLPGICARSCDCDLQSTSLNSTGRLQESVELSLLCLKLAVSSNVVLADEDVGNASLAGDVFESILKGGSIVCANTC